MIYFLQTATNISPRTLSSEYLMLNNPRVISHWVNLLSRMRLTMVANISELGQRELEKSRMPPVVKTQASYSIHVY